jgi:hypothetical protein
VNSKKQRKIKEYINIDQKSKKVKKMSYFESPREKKRKENK